MERLTFIQDSRVGRAIFQTNGDHLDVSYTFLGRKSQIRVNLRTVDPRPARRRWRFAAQPIALFGIALLGMAVTVGVWRALPDDAKMVAIWFGISPVILLVQAVRLLRPMEVFFFCNHWGRQVFFIVREPRQGFECDAFVASLVERIRRATHGEDALAAEERAAPAPPQPPPVFLTKKWPWAVIVGAIAVIFPHVPGVEEALGNDMVQFTGFLISAGGTLPAFFSFRDRERLRYISLVGAALCLAAPVFY